jgi:thiamine transport system permease protein
VTSSRTRAGLLLAGPPLLFLAVFYFYPLGSILWLGFSPREEWMGGGTALYSSSYYLETLWFTCWQAALSTVLTLACALPGAYIFARYSFRGRRLVQALATVPFVLPTVVVAAAFQALLGTKGLINTGLMEAFNLKTPPIRLDQTLWLFLLAHVFYNVAVVQRIVGGYWAQVGSTLTDAARMLGASPRRVFFKVTLPMLSPALLASSLLVFIFCFTSFGVVLILGGPRYATLEVEIFRQTAHLFNLPLAALLSLLQIGFTFGLMLAYTLVQRRASFAIDPESAARTRKPVRRLSDRVVVGGNLLFLGVFLGAPLAALLVRSVSSADGFTLNYYLSLFENPAGSISFVPPFQAALNSVGFAGAAMILALALGALAASYLARPKSGVAALLDPLFMLPLATSAVTLGFGFIIALDEPPLNLRTSRLLIPLAHTLVAFPFVVRSLLPVMRSIPPALREAASILGASPLQVRRYVDAPIMARAASVAAVFAFAVSMGEFGASVFVARPDVPTLPVAIYRFISQPGASQYGQAMAMSCILMAVTTAAFLLLEKLRSGPGGEF